MGRILSLVGTPFALLLLSTASATPLTWTIVSSSTSGPDVDYAEMVHSKAGFVAVGQDISGGQSVIVESADGGTWNKVYAGSGPLATVAYGNGMYIAGGRQWVSSTDTVNWEPIAGLTGDSVSDIVFGNGRFVAFAGPCPARCSAITSTDGKTWSRHALPSALFQISFDTYLPLGYDGTRFVSVGATDANAPTDGKDAIPVYTSCDGATWSHSADMSVGPATAFTHIRRVGSKLAALGSMACVSPYNPDACTGDPGSPIIATSADASHWTVVDASNLNGGFTDVAFAGDVYYAAVGFGAGQGSGSIATSPDAVNWSYATGIPGAPGSTITTFVTDSTHIYAAGDEGSIIAAVVSGADPTPTGAVCKDLPSIDKTSSSSGTLDLLTLSGLLGLLAFRRRVGI